MTITELRQKSADVLVKEVAEKRDALRKARFSAKQKQLKNVREIRDLRMSISQMLTVLHSKKNEKKEKVGV